MKSAFQRGGCFLIAFGTVWSAVTLTFDVLITRTVMQQQQAVQYPTTTGVVRSADIEKHTSSNSNGGTSTSYKPVIVFEYTVNDTVYTSDTWRFGAMSSSQKNARNVVQRFPVGQQVTVHYDPNNISHAVLQTGIDGTDLFLILFITPFNIVMLSIWWAIGALARFNRFPPVAGGVRIFRDGMTNLRARVESPSPLIRAVVAAFIGSFIAIFVGAFAFRMAPTIAQMQIVWASVGGLALAVFVYTALTRSIRSKFLEVDLTQGRLVLPAILGRSESLVLDIDDIVKVKAARAKVKPIVDAGPPEHADAGADAMDSPAKARAGNWQTMVMTRSDSYPAASFHSQTRAELFTQWLAAKADVGHDAKTDLNEN